MFNTDSIYEVVVFSIGDTKAGTKMGKLQLKNTEDNSVLNCILWEETLNRIDSKVSDAETSCGWCQHRLTKNSTTALCLLSNLSKKQKQD